MGSKPVRDAAPTPPVGAFAPSKAPTRRRNASRGLRMAQNPHHRRRFERARTRPEPMRIGCPDADRLISYPHARNLSISQSPIRVRGRFRRRGGQRQTGRPDLSAGGGARGLIKVPEVATKFAQQTPLPPAPANKFARQATKRPFWAILPAQGELSRAHAAASAPTTRPGGRSAR